MRIISFLDILWDDFERGYPKLCFTLCTVVAITIMVTGVIAGNKLQEWLPEVTHFFVYWVTVGVLVSCFAGFVGYCLYLRVKELFRYLVETWEKTDE